MIRVKTEPSLALIKYWGKVNGGKNIPATSSLAVSLGGLETVSEIRVLDPAAGDSVSMNGHQQQDTKITEFLAALRQEYPETRKTGFAIDSTNSFPTAAGLASSSSGFAALAIGCTRAAGLQLPDSELSRLARSGSGSAARAVFGGFTLFPAGATEAQAILPASHWPELRIVAVMVSTKAKHIGSRDAMNSTSLTSPYYQSWCEMSAGLETAAVKALQDRDLASLGPLMRRSYMSMFGSMLAADPAIVYWLPDSLALIRRAEEWRQAGLAVWETMDAGPQVKMLVTEDQLDQLLELLGKDFPHLGVITAMPGEGPTVTITEVE